MTSQTARSFKDASSSETINDLLRLGKRRYHPAGKTFFSQGEPGNELFVIETGHVEVGTLTQAGRKVVLGHLGAGDLVGEISLLDQSSRSASATALSDVTGQAIGFEDFRAFLLSHPDVHFGLTRELCTKLRNTNSLLEDQTEKAGPARLARCLLRLLDKFGSKSGSSNSITMKLSQSDLGELSGLARPNVNRYLKTWSHDNIVAFADGKLDVVDIDRLVKIARADD